MALGIELMALKSEFVGEVVDIEVGDGQALDVGDSRGFKLAATPKLKLVLRAAGVLTFQNKVIG